MLVENRKVLTECLDVIFIEFIFHVFYHQCRFTNLLK